MLPIVSILGFLASYISLVGDEFDLWSFTEYSVLVLYMERVQCQGRRSV